MAAAGEQAPSTEPKMATSVMAQETAITIKDNAKSEKAHFGNYWARKTLPMSVGMLMFSRESSRTEREKIVLRFSLHSSAPSAQAP
jgi:hypothetical protein